MKNSKNYLLNQLIIAGLFVIISIIFIQCQNSNSGTTEQKITEYTCPMHPEVVQDTPGNCPKCGMALVEKTDDSMNNMETEHGMMEMDSNMIETDSMMTN